MVWFLFVRLLVVVARPWRRRRYPRALHRDVPWGMPAVAAGVTVAQPVAVDGPRSDCVGREGEALLVDYFLGPWSPIQQIILN